MKRRTFLSLFGSATVAPALPAMAATPSAAVWTAAKTHAVKHPFVSVLGLSHRLKVSKPEAEVLIQELSRKGFIGNLRINGARPIYASSHVYVPTKGSLIEAARQQNAERAARRKAFQNQREAQRPDPKRFDVDLSRLIAHLRGLCAEQGMVLA